MNPDNGAPSGYGNFERCTAQRPCPICGSKQWCQMIGESVAQCMSVSKGSYKSIEQADGATAYLHRINSNGLPEALPMRPPSGRAETKLIHDVYLTLLNTLGLSLTSPRREALRRRGFSDQQINRLNFRDFRAGKERRRAARLLYRQSGTAVFGVPGIVVRDSGKGPYPTLAGPEGLLIPVRDRQGLILALKIRRDDDAVAADPGQKNKYLYLSSFSKKWPGPKAVDALHVPLETDLSGARLRVTEGPLKADLCS